MCSTIIIIIMIMMWYGCGARVRMNMIFVILTEVRVMSPHIWGISGDMQLPYTEPVAKGVNWNSRSRAILHTARFVESLNVDSPY